ncbi:unnamed protein product [Haemonchus placei]|uniref:Uncharacterized protein n=1 Tax=Haemonchus placei TaxID=6290 RepID=A0A3P7VTD1_HAEPC|nr:unnamed protein product [Haemonchus placei]
MEAPPCTSWTTVAHVDLWSFTRERLVWITSCRPVSRFRAIHGLGRTTKKSSFENVYIFLERSFYLPSDVRHELDAFLRASLSLYP